MNAVSRAGDHGLSPDLFQASLLRLPAMPALDREAISEMRKAAPTLFRTLVTDRNIRWTKMLDQRLKGHGHTVVVVGVGHLIGAGSVPARLRALGYSVTGP